MKHKLYCTLVQSEHEPGSHDSVSEVTMAVYERVVAVGLTLKLFGHKSNHKALIQAFKF